MKIKPSLAEDAILDKVKLPCWVQPKIDGVRGMNLDGKLTGRSLDPFPGFGVTEYFSRPEFQGLDGELTLGNCPLAEGLCSQTTGALAKFIGVSEMPDIHWWVFDYVTPDTASLHYHTRYTLLKNKVWALGNSRLHVVPSRECNSLAELEAVIKEFQDAGYEGTIIRNPDAAYKEGRATQKGQQLWRVKPWSDFEILVTGVTEGQRNENEAKKNTLGRTERSSAKDGMVPNGQVGSIQGTLVADLVVNGGALTIPAGTAVTAGSGKMTVEEATDFFQNPHKIIGHYAKIKTMTYGVKDLPRFPTYESLRLKQDMS